MSQGGWICDPLMRIADPRDSLAGGTVVNEVAPGAGTTQDVAIGR